MNREDGEVSWSRNFGGFCQTNTCACDGNKIEFSTLDKQ